MKRPAARAAGPEIRLGRVKAWAESSPPRVAIVTGSGKGIGRGIAIALARAGYRVVVNYRSDLRSARETARLAGGTTRVVQADVARPSGAEKLVRFAMRAWGRVDLFVNNVGDFVLSPVGRMDLRVFEAMYASNVRTALHGARAVLPVMRRQKGGVIVNIGGTATTSLRGNRNAAAYVMAKTALAVFTRSLAQAEARAGLRINMINPGYIRTYAYGEAEAKALAAQVPAGRLGTPEDVAQAVVWLAGDGAAYVNGAVVDVGGALWV